MPGIFMKTDFFPRVGRLYPLFGIVVVYFERHVKVSEGIRPSEVNVVHVDSVFKNRNVCGSQILVKNF